MDDREHRAWRALPQVRAELERRFGVETRLVDERLTSACSRAVAGRGGRARCAGASRCSIRSRRKPFWKPSSKPMTTLPDAERLLDDLAEQMRRDPRPETALVGIYTGGVWVAERLHRDAGTVGADRDHRRGVLSRRLQEDRHAPGREALRHSLRGRRRRHHPGRRRAVHRTHHPRGDERDLRLRPPDFDPAGRAGRSRRPRAADLPAVRRRADARRAAIRPSSLHRDDGWAR